MGKKALLKDAAKAVGLTRNALYRMARAGEVPYIRVGGARGRYVFDIEQLEEFLKQKALENVRQPEEDGYGKLRVVR
jgi:excisionase family DNA binding protein